ncbi:bifunctional proline dehydrogenase/L-glutamate gamma-semialdehyde dehydrogenase [Protaetiibacter intestinalis]|uniref:L-glutamate gamma-semialdehyde dehydrogenase n=1 Tax=Protaetiibacter intestinalis TaxID=2419774 RepID=A0A387B6G7_9MICO|nr:bifunctional proline dehydrogenase/L-glutamate gamma-semialdehyde dehydrogenase [Protaetiibacter intestinalis]AYF97943.1 aldehyde dehydrogenase family protein [Protaetiibacter intestinalis]
MAVSPDLPDADATIALVRRWLTAAAAAKPDPGAERLAGLLKDPDGLEFTLGFVDRVVRPDDLRVAARNFERLSRRVPRFLPWHLRALVTLGGGAGVLLPWPVIPIARRVLRGMVEHLVIDATPAKLDKSLARLRSHGARLNLNLLGEAVLGDREAARRLEGTRELLARDDVDYVSVKVSSVAAQLSLWGFDETVDRVVEHLAPLYEQAASARGTKFVNLDMEEYRDLDLTIAAFTRLLDRPSLQQLEAGIVLQAYLPDSVAALASLTEWARARVAAGGAGIKVRIVKGANLALERVDARIHGWPLATWPSKQATDTNYKRMLVAALTPEATDAVRVGVAGHNLFDLAFAWQLAVERGVEHRVEVEMLLGMASAQAQAVRADTRRLLLYTPVVHPEEFDTAIGYLVRRLEENASTENFMSAIFELADDERAFAREAERFTASLAALDTEVPPPNRTQNRLSPPLPRAPQAFRNEPDTDPALVANRVWGRGILERSATSTLGEATVAAARIADADRLDALVAAAAEAGGHWGHVPPHTRAELLDRVGEVLAVYRGRLVEVMASETGKTIAEADVEVSEAVDFAHYYAERARELGAIRDARFAPVALTVVTPPWNFPVSIPAGGVLSALAAGSAVVLKPAHQARRSGAVLAEALWEAGVPRELLTLVDLAEGELGRRLVASPAVGRVLLTGSYETAALFRSWDPELPLLAETSGKNAIVVTASADLDLAVKDLVTSAFGNAGQKCSAASLAILVGTVGESERFRRQLADAVTSLAVGYPQDPAVTVGPLIEPVAGKLARGLTVLAEGESWLVKPRQLDGTDRLWSPGVRDGVAAGSEFHRTEYFGPVLGLMRAATLDEAIELQNAVPYGLTAGIHSLDAEEVAVWLDRVQAGNLYVNRPVTGAIVRRQPFGGWKRSSVGTGAKAGGPNTLLVLGDWHPVPAAPEGDLRLDGLEARVRTLVEAFQPALDYGGFDAVRRGALSDADAWAAEFGVARDVSQLGVERDVLRYRPAAVTVRLAEGGALAELVRVLAAAALARAPLAVSSAVPLRLGRLAGELGWKAVVEPDAAFAARAVRELPARIRLVGGDAAALAEALDGSPEVAVYAGPVTAAGRIELLPFLREQSVSITAHRFGTPDRAMIALRV